ncbi:hypothetical protein B0H19DRAFT_1070953 [Mycena capillaripes]|nr:hypothetical protein B0H19DRAFT_1070953 [Mycena capillaripes]
MGFKKALKIIKEKMNWLLSVAMGTGKSRRYLKPVKTVHFLYTLWDNRVIVALGFAVCFLPPRCDNGFDLTLHSTLLFSSKVPDIGDQALMLRVRRLPVPDPKTVNRLLSASRQVWLDGAQSDVAANSSVDANGGITRSGDAEASEVEPEELDEPFKDPCHPSPEPLVETRQTNMPESQVLNAFAHRIRLNPEDACRKNDGVWPEGTAAKAHETISVDTRIPRNALWMYLFKRDLLSGPVNIAVRGKCLVLTAERHAPICHFNLEGDMLVLREADFDEIVSTCVPGDSKNSARARHLRSFPLPQRFVHPGACHKAVRKINILAVIVMNEDLWETHLWKRFRGRPDWIVETDAVFAGLDSWCAKVLKYQLRTPIIEELLDVTGPAAGVGQHLANNLLFGLALHTEIPSLTICSSYELHQELRAYLPVFMGTPYHGEWTMYTGKWKDVPVQRRQSNMYYVIRATPLADWNASTEERTKKRGHRAIHTVNKENDSRVEDVVQYHTGSCAKFTYTYGDHTRGEIRRPNERVRILIGTKSDVAGVPHFIRSLDCSCGLKDTQGGLDWYHDQLRWHKRIYKFTYVTYAEDLSSPIQIQADMMFK